VRNGSVLLRVPSPGSIAGTAHSACLVHRQPGSARCVWTTWQQQENLRVCVCVVWVIY